MDCYGFKIREQRFFQFLSCIVKQLPLTAYLVLYEYSVSVRFIIQILTLHARLHIDSTYRKLRA